MVRRAPASALVSAWLNNPAHPAAAVGWYCLWYPLLPDLRAAVASRGNAFYQKTCHFVSNHDEPRAAAALGGDQQGFVGAVVTSTLPGARMFYFGQFQGFSSRLLVQLRREVAQPINHTVWGLYDQLVKIVDNPVFHQGTWTNIPTSTSGTEWRLVAWRWALGSHKRLVVVNFSNEQVRWRV